MKDYKIVMRVEAPDKKTADKWVDAIAERSERYHIEVWDGEVIDEDERHYEGRIRYEEDWYGKGEHYVFEGRWSDEEWGLDTAFKLLDYNEQKGILLNYEALTKIREWMRLGIPFHFGK